MIVATVGHMARTQLLLAPIVAMDILTLVTHRYSPPPPHSTDGLSNISSLLLLDCSSDGLSDISGPSLLDCTVATA
jgi:hypothetical protein